MTGWPSTAAATIASRFDLRGPCLSPVAACATGVAAIVRGMLAIQTGECDVVFAGSADDSLHPGVLSSFQRLGVLARSDNPATACRPFDRTRQGFVVGAGAACLILERRSHAERRGAAWYAEILAGRLATDPAGITQLDESGDSLTHLISATCWDLRPDFVQLHGTGTRTNDPVECRAMGSVFGDAARFMLAGGIKGAIGHLLGAAGSVETAMTCLSLRDQMIPPCANLMDVDPACDLSFVRAKAVTAPIQTALKLSLGFGGHQAALLLRRGNRGSR
jgi:3-oxoacyl-[acyl-carrier-protein] synthase II